MSLFSLFSKSNKSENNYPSDTLTARDGSQFKILFFKHASFLIQTPQKNIYIDPVKAYADYEHLPKADIILVTHSHYDHLDTEAIALISTPSTLIICDHTSAEQLATECKVLRPGLITQPFEDIKVKAVAAYNTSQGHREFHPKEREDCGYIIYIGGTTIYVAGDGEPTPEMLSLKNIDIAFLPVNQPYTMTVKQAVEAVRAIRPQIFYPYHYGEVDEKTDIDKLAADLEGVCEVRIRPME